MGLPCLCLWLETIEPFKTPFTNIEKRGRYHILQISSESNYEESPRLREFLIDSLIPPCHKFYSCLT